MTNDNLQLGLWRGSFGDTYTKRNAATTDAIRARTRLWAGILDRLPGPAPNSILEVGANVGTNLRALRLLSGAELYALEPNETARQTMVEQGVVDLAHIVSGHCAAIELPDGVIDLAFTSGVLIHVHPDDLEAACRDLVRVAKRYLVIIEYFSDRPETVFYRGQANALFKRDFGDFVATHFREVTPIDCGFAWRRLTGVDNLTWWIFKKRTCP